jgi:hypothetical protein
MDLFSCSPLLDDCENGGDNITAHAHRIALVIDDDVTVHDRNDSDVINRIGFRLQSIKLEDAGLYGFQMVSDNNIIRQELLLYVYQKPNKPSITGKLSRTTSLRVPEAKQAVDYR